MWQPANLTMSVGMLAGWFDVRWRGLTKHSSTKNYLIRMLLSGAQNVWSGPFKKGKTWKTTRNTNDFQQHCTWIECSLCKSAKFIFLLAQMTIPQHRFKQLMSFCLVSNVVLIFNSRFFLSSFFVIYFQPLLRWVLQSSHVERKKDCHCFHCFFITQIDPESYPPSLSFDLEQWTAHCKVMSSALSSFDFLPSISLCIYSLYYLQARLSTSTIAFLDVCTTINDGVVGWIFFFLHHSLFLWLNFRTNNKSVIKPVFPPLFQHYIFLNRAHIDSGTWNTVNKAWKS